MLWARGLIVSGGIRVGSTARVPWIAFAIATISDPVRASASDAASATAREPVENARPVSATEIVVDSGDTQVGTFLAATACE